MTVNVGDVIVVTSSKEKFHERYVGTEGEVVRVRRDYIDVMPHKEHWCRSTLGLSEKPLRPWAFLKSIFTVELATAQTELEDWS